MPELVEVKYSVTLRGVTGVTGFTEAHLGLNGSSLDDTNMARFFFA